MKVTLIFPRIGEIQPGQIPLGITTISSVLKQNDIDVELKDYSFHKNFESVKRDLDQINADLIGISMMSSYSNNALKIAEYLKQKNPKTPIVVGGPHPTTFPEKIISNPNIDFVFAGEAEYSFLELVKQLDSKKKDFKKIEGLYFKKNQKIIHGKPLTFIENLDELPLPDRDNFPNFKKYNKFIPFFPSGYPMTNIISSRGCPGRCTFCQPTLSKLFGKITRGRSPKSIVDEMEMLNKKYGIKYIFFSDSLFTYKKNRTIEFCKELIKRRLNIGWTCQSRVTTVDEESLRWMKRANCWIIEFGVESGSQKILDLANKDIKIEQIERAFRLCRKVGIATGVNFMIGFPEETKQDLRESLRLMKRIKPDQINIYITSPIPGTEMFEKAKEKGLLRTKDLDIIGRRNPHEGMYNKFISKEISDKYLKNFQKRFIKGYTKMMIIETLKGNKGPIIKVIFKRYYQIFKKNPKLAIKDILKLTMAGLFGVRIQYAQNV